MGLVVERQHIKVIVTVHVMHCLYYGKKKVDLCPQKV